MPGQSQQAVRSTGQDVWLVVDVSRSMDATDVAPSRLLRAQAELQRLAATFPADRLGLLVFGAMPDGWTLAGAGIIAASGLYTAHRERVRARQGG